MSVPDSVTAALGLVFLVGFVPLLPTEPVLISCGVLAASGKLPLQWVIITAITSCVLADLVNYGIGRRIGQPAIAKFAQRRTPALVLDWIKERLARNAEPILVAGRWLPGGGTIGAVLCGSLRFPLRRFALASMIGCTLWCLYATLLGYLGGELADDDIPLALGVSLGIAAVLSLPASMFLRAQRRRRAVTAVDIDDDPDLEPIAG
ncbi:DedA family protein [Kutzneria kofuensis]|uniref:Membrane protein DedA with SNARE-associated domain n=1 Tax=Kutzneria kofuensis TaxID=103725 RepID=A0A7W9KGY3_9PSEU|nr:DedA family protein [Kutzneria kofuensis]MBB5892394.1 membrane protein DedA with SNARE-associated domain [Kutzneria kofuensis]